MGGKMYTVAVRRNFIAQHYLVGGDWGKENSLHSHFYKVEVSLEGSELDQHGYLVDIVDIEKNLDSLVEYFSDQTLNSLPDFKNLNPSIENFCRIFWEKYSKKITAKSIEFLKVTLWENEIAWASYRQKL
jgi:6-pyruvoyltetrahydropterin/6-carboxytetrahydropterin synthase